jgi:hypothetical protein
MIATDLPATGPVDEFTRAHLRHLIEDRFGHFATLDLHLDLLDARGAWYAERALDSWSPSLPDSFFGLVNHVVRTQIPGPNPAPDLRSWLAAGRPGHDEFLTHHWDTFNRLAAIGRFAGPNSPRGSVDVDPETLEAARAVDSILTGWPREHLVEFELAYLKLPITLARRQITLPPIGS